MKLVPRLEFFRATHTACGGEVRIFLVGGDVGMLCSLCGAVENVTEALREARVPRA